MAVKYGKKVRELMVKEMKDLFENENGFVFSSFDNIKNVDIDSFRKKVKQSGTRHVVLKKRISKIAMDDAGLSEITGVLDERKNVGMTIIKDDPVLIAKILMEFAKANKNFNVSKGYLEGRSLEAEKVKELAELPSREQLLSMVLGTMNAPITGFVGVLASIIRSLCYVLKSLQEKKENSN